MPWLVAVLCGASLPVLAQLPGTFEELDPLDFGELAVARNDSVYSLTLSATGSYSLSEGILLISPGQPGRYRITDLPVSQPIMLELFQDFLSRAENRGPYLSLRDTGTNSPVSTDSNGTLEFRLGARLATDGLTRGYPDDTYQGVTTLRISHDSPNGTVQYDVDITVSGKLRSTLTATQQHELHFGKLAAWTSNSDSASLRLAPNGVTQISNPGTARIISFGNARAGVYHVLGGAPFAPVTLTLPTEVILTHTSATAGARLIVDSFVPLPATGLTLDAAGQATFSLGATLRTEQSANPLSEGAYTGSFSLLIEYP